MTDDTKSNIINFPEEKIHRNLNRRPENFDELEQTFNESKSELAYIITEEIMALIGPIFFRLGFPEIAKNDYTMIKNLIFSTMCREYGVYHPFQSLADNIHNIDERELIKFILNKISDKNK